MCCMSVLYHWLIGRMRRDLHPANFFVCDVNVKVNRQTSTRTCIRNEQAPINFNTCSSLYECWIAQTSTLMFSISLYECQSKLTQPRLSPFPPEPAHSRNYAQAHDGICAWSCKAVTACTFMCTSAILCTSAGLQTSTVMFSNSLYECWTKVTWPRLSPSSQNQPTLATTHKHTIGFVSDLGPSK